MDRTVYIALIFAGLMVLIPLVAVVATFITIHGVVSFMGYVALTFCLILGACAYAE